MTITRAVTVLLEDRLITFTRAVGLLRRRNLPERLMLVYVHGGCRLPGGVYVCGRRLRSEAGIACQQTLPFPLPDPL